MPPSSDLSQSTSRLLPAGKLPANLLAELLNDLPTQDPLLLLGPAVGEDAAVIDYVTGDGTVLVAKSDPITFATDEIGYYAVNICANDLAVTGATPRFFLPTLLLPASQADEVMARTIFGQIGDACRNLSIVVAGGHTEITHTVNQPVMAGTMLGEVSRSDFISSRGCQPDDLVLMAGIAPVEGVSIIAREKRAELLHAGWSATTLDRAANYLYEPGISVLAPARLAAETGSVTAMHDPTEGGIATGLQELAVAAGAGLEIDLDVIPVPELAQRLCAAFGLNPLGTIASGALLVTVRPDQAEQVIAIWRDHQITGTIIGRVIDEPGHLIGLRGGVQDMLPNFPADEITKLWA